MPIIITFIACIAHAKFDLSDSIAIQGAKGVGTVAGAIGGLAAGAGATIAADDAISEKAINLAKEKDQKIIANLEARNAELKQQGINDAIGPDGRRNEKQERDYIRKREYDENIRTIHLIKDTGYISGGNMKAVAPGVVATPIATIAGSVAGYKLASLGAYKIVALRHKVSTEVAKIAYEADISLSKHKAMLQAAYKGNKKEAFSLYKQYLNTLFKNTNGFNRLKELDQNYNKAINVVNQYRQQGFYGSTLNQFYNLVGVEQAELFFEACATATAIWALLYKKSYTRLNRMYYIKIIISEMEQTQS